MNRWDEIQATARDVASNIHSDPDHRNQMADDLIKLVGLMVDAVGKGVAIDGESNISDPDDESAHARYLTGEAIQQYAREAMEKSAGADLERYERSGLAPVWTPKGNAGRLTLAANRAADAVAANTEHGPARLDSIRSVDAVAEASQDCPFLPGDAIPACDFDPNCPTHGVPGKTAVTAVRDHVWVTAEEGDPDTLTDWICNTCRIARCDGSCGDASVGAAPDIDCTTHGNDQARQCVERCVGCGDPVDNGRAHGPNQGFGGCC